MKIMIATFVMAAALMGCSKKKADTTPTNIVSSVSGGNLTLTWPASHTGWTLQVQTNSRSVGLSNNWSTFESGYTDTNEAVIPIDKTTPTMFFRLFYQIP